MINDPPGSPVGIPAGATVAEYVQRRWGRAMRALPPRAVTVATTPVQLCQNNPRRFLLAVSNPTVNDCWELYTDTVSVTNGFKVQAGGGSVVYLADEDGELTTYDHWIISSQFGFNVIVIEAETI